ncbi:hypothetical protein [Marinobacter sp. S6332]|uniref:hypothetical protein n=1 Tax=Marinobacter sp. S6332 TaxID=2926403 RepID=UPI001FF56AE2|nr:hypothetical protein [Marinobacter sp. S6332]MCK0162626.1 hypothetical protein [Marinobacter sp. S6332]
MEEIAEGLIKSILRFAGLVVRSLIWLIWELCFWELGWYVGWPVCRILSFGYFPKEPINDQSYVNTLSGFIVSLIGLAALISVAALIAQSVGSG